MFKQLFFDDQRLLLNSNLKRVYGKAEAIPESIYIENCGAVPCDASVCKLPDGKYHLFYYVPLIKKEQDNVVKFEEGGVILAAVSDDGIHFKPRNTAKEAGLKNPKYENQVLDYFDGEFCTAVVDKFADESERIKLLIVELDRDHCHAVCSIMVSPDGIHWRRKNGGCWNVYGSEMGYACYNPIREKFLISARPDGGDRRVVISETKDWLNFSEPLLCMQCDSVDSTLAEIYTMVPFYYDGMMLSLIWMYNTIPTQHATKFAGGTMTVQLGYSFNGVHWQRALREDFLGTNDGEQELGFKPLMIMPGGIIREDDGSIRIYASATKLEHGAGFKTEGAGVVVQYRLREDGFIGLQTENDTEYAILCTRDNRWKGGELKVNISCEDATVALYNRENELYEGYSHEDCIAFSGDSCSWTPVWKNGKRLDELTDKIVQIELKFKNGTVYSFSGEYVPMMDLESHRWQYMGFDSTRKDK